VGVSVGVSVGVGVEEAAGLFVAGEDDLTAGLDDAARLLEAAGVRDAPVLDGVTEADGVVAAMAVPVMPPEITKRPVARPSVSGRACGDRMRTPCLCAVTPGIVRFGIRRHLGGRTAFWP